MVYIGRYFMVRLFKHTFACLALLFSAQGVQAAMAPTADVTLGMGALVPGVTYSGSQAIAEADEELPSGYYLPEAVIWYQFTLDSTASVFLDTTDPAGTRNGDTPAGADFTIIRTALALYDSTGSLLEQHSSELGDVECPITMSDRYACISRTLTAGTYLAGVTDLWLVGSLYPFSADWGIDGREYEFASFTALSVTTTAISAVPVPAAVWLFGTALIGFVGMARRTTVKS